MSSISNLLLMTGRSRYNVGVNEDKMENDFVERYGRVRESVSTDVSTYVV